MVFTEIVWPDKIKHTLFNSYKTRKYLLHRAGVEAKQKGNSCHNLLVVEPNNVFRHLQPFPMHVFVLVLELYRQTKDTFFVLFGTKTPFPDWYM